MYFNIILIYLFYSAKFWNLKLVAKKQYAKHKAMYLNKCFQTGQTPIPGPLVTGKKNKT